MHKCGGKGNDAGKGTGRWPPKGTLVRLHAPLPQQRIQAFPLAPCPLTLYPLAPFALPLGPCCP